MEKNGPRVAYRIGSTRQFHYSIEEGPGYGISWKKEILTGGLPGVSRLGEYAKLLSVNTSSLLPFAQLPLPTAQLLSDSHSRLGPSRVVIGYW